MSAADQYDEQSLRQAGFSDSEIAQDKAQVAQHLSQAGFSQKEVNDYFGVKEPDMGGIQKYVQQNLKAYKEAQKPADGAMGPPAPEPQPVQPRHAENFLDSLEAGYQISVSGLVARNKLPDIVPQEHAGMAMRIAAQAGQLGGDLPAMVAGGFMGGVAGTEVPGVGNVVGAGAGAFALPAAIRESYIQNLKKGAYQNFGDYWSRAMATTWEGLKGAVTGAATVASGGAAGAALEGTAPMVATLGKNAAELGVMTTVGKALEGQVPQAQDFVDGALLLTAMHGAVHVAGELPGAAKDVQGKLQDIYAKTGVRPAEVLQESQSNPVTAQQILSSNPEIPDSFKAISEDSPINPAPKTMQAETPKGLTDPSNTFGKGFAPEEKLEVPKPEPKPEVDPKVAEDPILSRLGTDAPKERMTFSQMYTKALDSLNPIKKVTEALQGEGDLDVKEDPYKLMRLAKASAGKAEVFVDHGPRYFETQEPTGTPGLKQILQPFKGDLDGFVKYAMSKRALELDERGIETGIPLDASKEYVDQTQGKYEKGFRQLVQFQNDTLSYLRDSGVLSDDAHENITVQNRDYIPMNRYLEDGSKGGSKGGVNPIKRIHGSDLKIVNPIEQIIRNTSAYVQIAEENRAKSAMIDLMAKNPDVAAELIQKVPTPLRPIEVRPDEIAKYLGDHGVVDDPESMTIFRQIAAPLAKDEMAVMRDGKREVYKVGEDVAKAFGALDYRPPNAAMRALSIPAKMIRTGAVDTADFLARHFLRDQNNAFVLSNNGYVPVYDAIRGLQAYFGETKAYQDWLAGGGGMSNMVSMDRDYIQNKVSELSKETGLIDKTMNVVKNPLDLFRSFIDVMHSGAEAITSAPRIGEFMRAQEAGKDIFTSAYDARNVTIDNQRMGSSNSVRALSMISAFWNTHIQGVDRMVQSFKDKPLETTAKMSLAVTLPSLMLWWQNKDDPRYQDLPRWQKDLFWIVMTKDNVYRIPKPFEQGILFGSLPERMLESFYQKNPNAFKGFGSALLDGALPNPVPNALTPLAEQFANRSILTGGNIIPHSLEQVSPQYQYTPYTSETAKLLGKMISYLPGTTDFRLTKGQFASPMIIQNYVRDWTGSMGAYALQIADNGLQAAGVVQTAPKPASTLADIPFIKAFVVRYPSASSQSVQDFYDNLEKTNQVHADIKHLTGLGDVKSAYSYMNSPEAQENMMNLQGMAKTIGTQNRTIQQIYSNPEMTPNDKRQLIDGIYYQMIQTAQFGNHMMRSMKDLHESGK